LREQQQKSRVTGSEATAANILAARSIANLLRTSLGPKGLDKMLVSPDGDVTVTNDGATILQQLQVDHPVARLMVELSAAQDDEIGDGTTGVVVLAGAILQQAESLLKKGVHPVRLAAGLEMGAALCQDHLQSISETLSRDSDVLMTTAATTLSSKIVHSHRQLMAQIAVDAVLAVQSETDVNLERIRLECKTGGSIADTQLVQGLVLDKEWSHPQMPKTCTDCKICLLTCPFEPPKPKTKHKLEITSPEAYEQLYQQEQDYFRNMVQLVKDSGATVVLCQWGFDDEANHLLLQAGLQAVRWVGGVELEHVALATGARIVPRFQDLTPACLGYAKAIKELTVGKERLLWMEQPACTTAVTVLIRGSSRMMVQEVKRSLHDALCVVRNLVQDATVVYGGGAAEMACANCVQAAADRMPGVDQYAIRALSKALQDVPAALAENAGLSPIAVAAEMRARQLQEQNPRLGLSSIGEIQDMREAGVFETLRGKQQQIQLAAQVVKMILKIDDVIAQTTPQ